MLGLVPNRADLQLYFEQRLTTTMLYLTSFYVLSSVVSLLFLTAAMLCGDNR